MLLFLIYLTPLGWLTPNTLVPILLAALVRTFVVEPFTVPSSSMEDGLLAGDYVFAAKYAYGYSRFSFPVPLVFEGRILGHAPRYGDVVVLRHPRNEEVNFIKRVVGLPGDRVQMIAGVLTINGTPVTRERMDDFVTARDGETVRIKRWRETLPNGVSHSTLDREDNSFYDNTTEVTVPEGAYFVLGDNRDNSLDSRAVTQVGFVPLDNMVARVDVIYFSLAESGEIRWDRLFTGVK